MNEYSDEKVNPRGKVIPKTKKEPPMPPYSVRFTDMPDLLVRRAVRLIAKCNEGNKSDNEVATAIHEAIKKDAELNDESAAWHVIIGKSFASAIKYQTDCVLFVDLLGDINKSFLIFKTSSLYNKE